MCHPDHTYHRRARLRRLCRCAKALGQHLVRLRLRLRVRARVRVRVRVGVRITDAAAPLAMAAHVAGCCGAVGWRGGRSANHQPMASRIWVGGRW